MTSVSFPQLLARANSTTITSSTNSTNATLPLAVIAVGITRTLPWWTSIIGGIADFLIGVYTISSGWKRQEPAHCAWTLSPSVNGVKTLLTASGLFMTFFQAVSGLAHLRQNWSTRDLVRKIGGNGYIGVFCIGAQLYSAKIRGRWIARIVAWIVAAVVITNFAEFTDPKIGTAPLYRIQSESCTGLLPDKGPNGGDCSHYDALTTLTSFSCAKGEDLGLHEPRPIPYLVNRIFLGILGLYFLATLIYHLSKDFEWVRWRRNGCPPIAQPLQQFQPPYQQYQHNFTGYASSPYSPPKPSLRIAQTDIPAATTNRGRDAYHPLNKNPHRLIAYAGALTLTATNIVAAYAYAQTYYASKDFAVSKTLGICLDVGNQTIGNITAVFGEKGNCTCVDLRLPGEVEDLGQLGESGMLARLLYNI